MEISTEFFRIGEVKMKEWLALGVLNDNEEDIQIQEASPRNFSRNFSKKLLEQTS